MPTKRMAAEDTSQDPNTSFINFTNFINATFITHLMESFEIINNFRF